MVTRTDPSPHASPGFAAATLTGRRVVALHIACIVALSLLLTWPLLIYGIPDLSHDGYHHARWAKQFATQFWQGDLFPRWFSNVNGGLGGPSGFFYPPLTNYVSSLFWPMLAGRETGPWLAVGYAVVLGGILSGIAAYLWLLSFGNAGAALLGAVVYVIAPYHLAIDVYMRGASAEFWVFVWFPLILLSAQRLIQGWKWAVPLAAVSFACAILSHPTLSACFIPIPLGFVFFFSGSKQRIRNTALLTAGLLIGIGLSAAYLVPATLYRSRAYTESYQTGHFDYRNEWLVQDGKQLEQTVRYISGADMSNEPGMDWYFPLRIRMLAVTISTLLAVAALFALNRRCKTEKRSRSITLFWTAIAFLFFFLMNSPSAFVWRIAGFLKLLQFPFRLNTMLVVCVAGLVPFAYRYLTRPRARLFTGFLCLTLIAWLAADLYSSRWNFSARGIGNPGRVEMYKPYLRTQIDSPEMWPIPGNVKALSDVAAFDWFTASHPPQTAQLTTDARQSSGTAQVETWRPRRVILKIEALRDTVLTVNHFYYSGWQARIEETRKQLAVRPSGDGLMEIDVPQGSYSLVLELPRRGAELAGLWISLFSLLLLAGDIGWTWRYRPRAIAAAAAA